MLLRDVGARSVQCAHTQTGEHVRAAPAWPEAAVRSVRGSALGSAGFIY